MKNFLKLFNYALLLLVVAFGIYFFKFLYDCLLFIFTIERVASFLRYFNFEISDSILLLSDLLFIFLGSLLVCVFFIFVPINAADIILDGVYKFLCINTKQNNPNTIFIKNLFEKLTGHFLALATFSFIAYLIVSFLLVTIHFIISINLLSDEHYRFDLILFAVELTNFNLKFLFNTIIVIVTYFN
jgi:hypothetical protein